MGNIWPKLRIGLLDMRGDLRRFVLLVVTMAVGTALIAGVSSVGAVIDRAMLREAAQLMGGDIELSRADRAASDADRVLFSGYGAVVETVDSNLRAQAGENDAFVDLSVVGPGYPLLGQIRSPQVAPGTDIQAFLAETENGHGALVAPLMLDQLGITVGDSFELGGTSFEVRGALDGIPDDQVRGFRLGLPALVTIDGFATVSDRTSPLPGLGTWFRYKILLDGQSADDAKAQLSEELSGSVWTIRTSREGLGEMVRYYDLFMRFLLIVGLGSLLIGGVSVWSGMNAYVGERSGVIAVLRSLGATTGRVFTHFFVQVAALTAVGVGIGIITGASIALLILPTIGDAVGIALAPTLDARALLVAASAGVIIALAFAYLPLLQAQTIRPAELFRSQRQALPPVDWRVVLLSWRALPLAVAALLFFLLALAMTGDAGLVALFIGAAALATILFELVIQLMQFVFKRLPDVPSLTLRRALRAITGSKSATMAVVVSIGLALSMLVVIIVLQNNLRQEYLGASVFDAPTLVASDLFDDEVADLEAMATAGSGMTKLVVTPMLRATLSAVNGVDVAQVRTDGPEASFLLGGEVPITYRTVLPSSSQVTRGDWWPADYAGPGLVSLHQSLRNGLDVDIGDTLTFDAFGEKFEAQVSNFRDYSWQGGTDFLATFSPGVLENYPSTLFAAVTAASGRETEVERLLASSLPDIRFIAIGDTLKQVTEALSQLTLAVVLVGSLAVGNGLLVLIGSLAAGRRQRQADAVITKVLGATRKQLLGGDFLQFLILSLAAAIPALGLGLGLGWLASMMLLNVQFSIDGSALAIVLAVAVLMTALLGCVTILRAVSVRPARLLRDL
ncbi:MAG: FtsX-like permease family protein [Devosia sp.]|jgi:putative ABC transport system permease protein|uniref:ABC transporter permease n=1 Tax=unclassified Devosia TaxID=196773 RepID=UPI001A03A8B1|nr:MULTISPECIES: FtsX-like permease family protein [unclassified Devosia]MBF0679176.1 FtsX-like permease family protein [Devosia sp.]WEJ32284.1 FtsX-like permease family protein [Devosia sp. SD17-2]